MVDAAGAIYVIGGNYFADVWVSTDGGARAGLGRGGGSGGTPGGYYRGYYRVLQGLVGGF